MNRAIRTVVAVIGILFAIGGITHGYSEVLQGSTATPGLMIEAIHESRQTWAYGGEAAFTLIPNFLVTGLAAIAVSIVIIIWCLRFLDTKHGATVFLVLFVLSLLVGGGIGQVAFFVPAWLFATRINKPLTWWRDALPQGFRQAIGGLWRWTVVLAAALVLIALEIAIFGYFPGVADAEQLMNIVMTSLGSALLLFVIAFISAVASDIERQREQGAMRPAVSR